jgi:hypothetical protein
MDDASDGDSLSSTYNCEIGGDLTSVNTPTQRAGQVLSYP